ncbi:uncharacterized protein HD556DRAFT_1241716, partial [Suillus plorans]
APEVALGTPWTYNADIWNLGLMLRLEISGMELTPCDGIDPGGVAHLVQLIGFVDYPPKVLLVAFF